MTDYDTDILTWAEHQAALLRRRAACETPDWIGASYTEDQVLGEWLP